MPLSVYSDGRDTSDVEEKVKKEIIENMDIAKGWQFKMVYDHWNGTYEREGKVTVYQGAVSRGGDRRYLFDGKRGKQNCLHV